MSALPPAARVLDVAALALLDLDGLRGAWRTRYGPPPRLRSPELLRLALAWRIQADAAGGLPTAVRRQLARTGPSACEGRALGIGARLSRNWQGRTIEVVVTEAGFVWEGRTYRSLSAAASAIAGSRWNGPRFFGLRGKAHIAQAARPTAAAGREAASGSTPHGR